MTLAELIAALEAADPNLVVPHGFTNPHSYRGYYDQVAFEPTGNVTVRAMLDDARKALGATFQGYKGGDFTMDEHTDCWLATWGACGEEIGPLLLRLMLAAGTPGPSEEVAAPGADRRVTVKPSEVPEEVMRAFVNGAIESPPDVKANSPEWVRNGLLRALAAYDAVRLPEHERQVRAKVSAEIEETIDADVPGEYEAGLARAARIARGGS